MYNLSAAMGSRWVEICNEFTERIKKLGPSPIWLARRRQQKIYIKKQAYNNKQEGTLKQ